MPTTFETEQVAEHSEWEDGVRYSIIIHPEDTDPEGDAIASGDEDVDAEVVAGINARLDRGDLWAWCIVECRAEWDRFSASDFLGGCSYRDAAEFRQEGGYWPDMKAAALQDLRESVEYIAGRVADRPAVLREVSA